MSGHVQLAGEFGFDADTQMATANQLSGKSSLQSNLFPGGLAEFGISGNVAFDTVKQTFTLADFELTIPELKLESGEQANLTLSGNVEGNIGNGRYQSQNLVIEGGISGDNVPGNNLPFKLMADIDANMSDDTLVVHEYRLDSAIANLTGNAALTQLTSDLRFKGELNVAAFNPREMLEKLGQAVPQTTDPKALSLLDLKTSFEGTASGITLKPLNAKLDDTSLSGSLSISDFATQAIRAELVVDKLNADRYLPPGTPAANPGAGATAAGGLPLETLRGLDIDAQLALGKLHVSDIDLDDIRVSLRAKDGLIKLSPLRAGLYGGTYEGNLTLDARGEQARISLNEKLTGVKVGELLSALAVDTGEMDLSDAAGDVSIKADVSGDPGKQHFKLKDASLKANVSGAALPGGKLIVAANADLDLDLAKQLVSASAVKLAVKNLKLPNGLRTTGTLTADAVTARLNSETYSATGVDVDLKALQLSAKANATPLKLLVAQLEADLKKQTLTADSFDISALSLKAGGNIAIASMIDNPQLAGVLEVTSLNPKQLMEVLGIPAIETRNRDVLTSLVVQTTFTASQNSVSLRPLSLTLDDKTQINGGIEIADIQALKGINFNLTVTSIKADDYLPPEAEEQTATALPIDLLRKLDVNGTLTINQLQFSDLELTDINLTVTGKDGEVKVNPLGALLYDGRYTGDITLDARGKAAELTLNESVDGVQIEPLLGAYTGKEAKLSGRGRITIQATASGADSKQMLENLNGHTELYLVDGAFKGINIVNSICNLVEGGAGGETRFAAMEMIGDIENGVLKSNHLKVQSPVVRASGVGTVDLVREYIDYLATVSLVGTCQGQGGLALADLGGIDIPVAVTGPFDNPSYAPDYKAIITQSGGKVDELVKKLGIKELEGLGNLLGGGTQQQGGNSLPTEVLQQGGNSLPTEVLQQDGNSLPTEVLQQDGNTLPTETLQQPAQPQKKLDPLEELGKDLLKGLFN